MTSESYPSSAALAEAASATVLKYGLEWLGVMITIRGFSSAIAPAANRDTTISRVISRATIFFMGLPPLCVGPIFSTVRPVQETYEKRFSGACAARDSVAPLLMVLL